MTSTNVEMFDNNRQCCGCFACEAICPKHAIKMEYSDRGFYIPVVDENKCINCKKCVSVCNIHNPKVEKWHPKKIYAAYNPNYDDQKQNSSGGIFARVCNALHLLYNENFYCYGASYIDMSVYHCGTNKQLEFKKFYGSKYVQSNLSGVYTDITEKLKNSKVVLFTGTGCQCAALRSYIRENRIDDTNLFVIDIICHGVPSARMWKEYLCEIERLNQVEIVDYIFRDKDISWHGIHPRISTTSDKFVKNDEICKSYGALFGNLSINEICHDCPYACSERVGDLTLGDFWNVDKEKHCISSHMGVSECLVNSSKGEYIFSLLLDEITSFEVTDDSYLQPQLISPTKRNIRHNMFWKDYLSHGYLYVARKYTKNSIPRRIYRFLTHSKVENE